MDIKKPRTFIVDDDPDIRAILRSLLTIVNFEVIGEASSGGEAVEKFFSLTPDFVLLDVNMPGKTGDKVLESIKDNIADTCIIMVSQISEIDIVKKCVDLGAFYYIKKDISFPQMIKIIQNTWEKYIKIKNSGNEKSIKATNTLANAKEHIYNKIIEDKFYFMLYSRQIMDKQNWQRMLESYGNAYNVLLNLVEENNQIKEQLGWLWAAAMNCSFINPEKTVINDDLVQKIPRNVAEKFGIIPLYDIDKAVCVAFSRSLSTDEKTTISKMLGNKEIDFIFSFPDNIEKSINKYYYRKAYG